MKVGYVRVSTVEQNPARQEELMKSFGVDKVYSEKLSGKDTNRPQFKEMLSFLREGDTLYVESFSRLSRSTRDLIDTVNALNEKGVSLVSDKEKIDTTTPQGRLVMTVFAAIYQFERENTLERQREGIAIAKREGKYKGRKPIEVTDSFLKIARKWEKGELTLKDAIAQSGMSQSTFFRKCKEQGIKKEVSA
jgi:DNA invertase Pin-like site-specific DNA recombinase|nr:MAG TPA: gamma delta Resolvase, site specific recombination [Caudoviricetes sp.]